ncbi:MAG: DUF262 domain-containing protein [Caldilineaceae bacterium]
MAQDLVIRGESIQRIYNDYVNKRFLVNRQYQRKLVWTVQQKEKLIESVYKGYPIPLILLTEVRREGRVMYEIIDGLQRLDAITSFIEGSYPFKGRYFDLNTLAETKERLEAGELRQNEPILAQDLCTAIVSYEVPFSIYRLADKERNNIDEIFLRVNTEGRPLTKQEIRQASSLYPFGQLVRRISSEIRGDASSSDVLRLDQMKRISISSRDLKYGIDIENIPWIKNNIIVGENRIRESQDEELVANLVAYMVLRTESNPNDTALDSYYKMGKNGRKIKQQIQEVGTASLEQEFLTVYDEVNKLLNASGYTKFTQWIFKSSQPVDVDRYYQVIFLAIHELLIRRRMDIQDHKRVAKLMEGLAMNRSFAELVEGPYWKNENRYLCVNRVVASLEKISGIFTRRPQDMLLPGGGDLRIKRILDQFLIENTLCAFKANYYPFPDSEASEQNGTVPLTSVFQTLTSVANQGPRSVGYVIVGITRSKLEAEKYKSAYGCDPLSYGEFYITGIEGEAQYHCEGVINYYHALREAVKEQPITPPMVKEQVAQDIGLYTYQGKFVIIMRIEAPDAEPSMYDGKIYSHTGFDSYEVPINKWRDIFARFQ